MNKKLAITLILVAFVAGAAGGWSYAGYQWSRFFTLYFAATETSHVSLTLGTLKKLRANDFACSIESLEVSLDGSLSTLGATFNDIPESEREKTLKALGKAKAYRAQFPRKTEIPEDDQEVERALALANERTNR
jgi:hypothetical protein